MSLERLFRLIREEDVAIWIGAGFSLYAGYPSGKDLQQKIYNQLTEEEKSQILDNRSLRATSSAFMTFRNGSRKELYQIIKDEFNKTPISTHHHDMLSRIPHFHKIITTNYDSLIENSYAGRAIVIRKDTDIPYYKHLVPMIYKPHGDLECLDRLVITDSDYINFQNIQKHNPFWVSILDILAKNSLLFLGYSFEDENVNAWIDFIDKAVGNNRKERFLVAPDWPPLKIKQLAERHITYIDSNAYTFLENLNRSLKRNLAADLENGIVSQDTYSKFCYFHNVNTDMSTVDGVHKVAALYNINGTTNYQVNLQVNDKKVARRILDFNKGFGKSIEISTKYLHEFEYLIEGFKMNIDASTLSKLELRRLPEGHKCSLEIPDIDVLIEDISFEIYKESKAKAVIEAEVWGYKIIANLHFGVGGTNINFELNSPPKIPSIHKSILLHKALLNYCAGKDLLIHINGATKTAKGGKNFNLDFKRMENELRLFKGLRAIEKYFKVKFDGANWDFSKKIQQLVKNLNDLIVHKYIKIEEANGFAIRKKQEVDNQVFNELPKHITTLLLRSGENEIIELLGQKIDLGEGGLEIQDIEPLTFNSDRTIAVIKSKTNRYLKRYSGISSFESVQNLDV